ncbi:hypothetical protein QFZ99_000877 [Paraburkholderia atlantica]|uniref:antirestriction protein n=1 Tax=Paraburkholderia atlantica TaxID=2654982 RepID=UPI003D1B7313
MNDKPTTMTAEIISESRRLDFMPDMFGPRHFIPGESMLYGFANGLLPDYDGGLWTFHRVSNGARFAAPPERERWRVVVAGNYTDREVSTEAAGIILSLFALGAMAERASARDDGAATDFLCDRYYELRAYACEHPEYRAILAAID